MKEKRQMDWTSFLPPFFGVLAAFFLQWLGRMYDKRKDRQQFLGEVKTELGSCSQLLTGKGNLLPVDMWESGKASGFLSLIHHKVKIKLAAVYFSIECHNYEAEKVRDVGILGEALRSFSDVEKFHVALSDRLVKSEGELKNEIDKLLGERDIFNGKKKKCLMRS
jgi:hypothetical protein